MNTQTLRFAVVDDSMSEIDDIVYLLRDSAQKYNLDFSMIIPKTDSDIKEILRDVVSKTYAGLIIDQRLGEFSFITSRGIEIARDIRSINKSIPIFILTKYINDDQLFECGFSIDDVIGKIDIVHHPEAFLGRMLRSASRYVDYNASLSKEFDEIIKLSFDRNLSKTESNRLIEIRKELSPLGLLDGALQDKKSKDDEITARLDNVLENLNRIINKEE